MEIGFLRAWLEINLRATKDNFRMIQQIASPCEVLSVLKADGYGLGVSALVRAMIDAGAKRIGVASASEALEVLDIIRSENLNQNITLQVMSAVFPEELPILLENHIELPITDAPMAQRIANEALHRGTRARCHLKIDAGMGRLGIPIEEARKIVPQCCSLNGILPIGIFSHFPFSCEQFPEKCSYQINAMSDLIRDFEKLGLLFQWRHIANSDAINHFPPALHHPFNMVRAGITQHGLCDNGETSPKWARPVASFRSRLAAVRTLPAGRTIGYGGTYTLHHPMRIGTISAGYADGVPLALSNLGSVLLNGQRCPIVGRISMDYTTIDLTNVPNANVGDVVTLFGQDGDLSITVDEWAAFKKTHPYDILSSITPRVRRLYVEEEPTIHGEEINHPTSK